MKKKDTPRSHKPPASDDEKRSESPGNQFDEERREKNVAYYSAIVNAWVETRMEIDKTLIALSSGGIGLIATLLTALHITTWCPIVFAILDLLCFLITIITCLQIFKENGPYLKGVVNYTNEPDLKVREKLDAVRKKQEAHLDRLDYLASRAFVCGMILAILVGIFSAMSNVMEKGDRNMCDDEKVRLPQTSERIPLNESLSGMSDLAPQGAERFSLSGMSGLAPQASSGGDSGNSVSSSPTASSGSSEGAGTSQGQSGQTNKK